MAEKTPEEIALERIRGAKKVGAKELYLSRLNLTDLPAELWTLGALKLLDLSHNKLKSLPSEIGQLHKLTHFYVNDFSFAKIRRALEIW